MKKHVRISILLCVFACLFVLSTLASCGAKNDFKLMADRADGSSAENTGGMTNTSATLSPNTDGKEGTKIIKTYDLTAETTDFAAATESLNALITEHGGYVESSSTSDRSLSSNNRDYRRTARYTLRIPAENADAFVTSVGNTLHLTSNSARVEDISETYYSIEAKLQELQTERDSLLEILNAPETTKDYNLWLTVKQRLSEVTQQIAVYQGQIKRFDSKVAYSTVTLTLGEVLSYSAISENNRFGSRLSTAFRDGWNGFVTGLQDFTLWLAEALSTLILLAVMTVAVIFTVRLVRKKRRNNKTARQDPPSDSQKQETNDD